MCTGVKSVGKNGEKVMYDFESRVNQAVFPALQGGPHNHQIGAIATAMLQAQTPEFKQYQIQVTPLMQHSLQLDQQMFYQSDSKRFCSMWKLL